MSELEIGLLTTHFREHSRCTPLAAKRPVGAASRLASTACLTMDVKPLSTWNRIKYAYSIPTRKDSINKPEPHDRENENQSEAVSAQQHRQRDQREPARVNTPASKQGCTQQALNRLARDHSTAPIQPRGPQACPLDHGKCRGVHPDMRLSREARSIPSKFARFTERQIT